MRTQQQRTKRRLIATAMAVALFGATSVQAEVRALVGHFAPFADSLSGTSVSIRVNGATALENVVFGQFTEYLSLGDAGMYTLEVVPTGSTEAAISAEVMLPDGDYTVLAAGDGVNQPLSLLALSDEPTAGDQVNLRVVHAAPFAATAEATSVSIRDQNNEVVGGLASVPFGANSGFLVVPPGRYDLKVASPDGTTDFIDARPVDLPAGAVVTVVATGGANGFPLGLTAIADGAAPSNPLALFEIGPVQIAIAHLAPFAADLDGTAVNVLVNGGQILSGVRYKDFTDFLTLPAQGAYQVDVVPVGASEPAISGEVALDGNRSYVAAAIGNGLTQPLDLLLVEAPTVQNEGDYALRIVHAAPFAATAEATSVSIRTDGGDVVAGLASVPYGAFSPSLSLPVGTLDVKVATPDGSTNLIDLAPVDLPAGAAATVFAIGDGINQPLGILAVPFGELPLETPVDFSANGHWSVVGQDFNGFSLVPMPGQNRLTGTWYSYAPSGGAQAWFFIDSCQSAAGAEGCAVPGGFDNASSTMSVYATSGGSFNDPTGGAATLTEVGTITIDFGETPCSRAEASFDVEGFGSGSFQIENLTPGAGCQ
jgi:hypothetical protein